MYPYHHLLFALFSSLLVLSYTGAVDDGLPPATKAKIADLWLMVKKTRQVEAPAIRTVEPAPAKVDVGMPPNTKEYASNTRMPDDVTNLRLPSTFTYGVAMAAAQVEGAVKIDFRGPTLWDALAHLVPGSIRNNDAFDVATNFRFLYKVDIARAAAMGVDHYSFSVSWTRIMPLGRGEVSTPGMDFYLDVIDTIHSYNMTPVVTLVHWDIPLALELEYGSMTDPKFVDDFAAYADVIFRALGSRGVKTFFTFNEPTIVTHYSLPPIRQQLGRVIGNKTVHLDYKEGEDPLPAIRWKSSGYLLLAHAKAVKLFREGKGRHLDKDSMIGIKNTGSVPLPYRQGSVADEIAVNRADEIDNGFFSIPVHITGDFPEWTRREMPELPAFTDEEKSMIKGSADLYCHDWYNTFIAKATEVDGGYKSCVGNRTHPKWPSCIDETNFTFANGTEVGEQGDPSIPWMRNTAFALRRHLSWINARYPTPGGLYYCEFGWPERGEQNKTSIEDLRMDGGRQRYYRDHFAEILKAVNIDKIDLRGVYAWSLTANIEWNQGFESHFGLQAVDENRQDLPRTFLGSFYFVRDFFKGYRDAKKS